ncbi:MAG: geranylgeranyl diphosphate reductase [Gemmatimonadaceae bacterium]|jgi:geranylgeranyl reductase|nr:geranylgeranyl diphosphate reductase [Gemmatimonadaceae bacterium]
MKTWDVVVVGGGPSGATAANELALLGYDVALLDKAGRVKPCGGAVPPQIMVDFDVPESLMVAKVETARMVSPTRQAVDIPVGKGYVGMVDRGVFDEWLRERARTNGATRLTGLFKRFTRDTDGTLLVHHTVGNSRNAPEGVLRTRQLIGADGALSAVARQALPVAYRGSRRVTAYHEIIESPLIESDAFKAARADVIYDGRFSPDFYAWIFPHGPVTSVGTGTFRQGFDMRAAIAELRRESGLDACATIRCEGAPIPLRPLDWWENGRDISVTGDAAGVVAPASGEGIFYAMTCGRFTAQAVGEALRTGKGAKLTAARRRFLWHHGNVFRVLDVMQSFWYSTDDRRERFVKICRDEDVQRLTFEAYMRKKLVRAKPLAHARIFFKNIGHLTGLLSPA